MTPEQMRELADRLSDPCSPDDDDLETAADYLRAQAEPKPIPASGDDLGIYKRMADSYRNDAQAEPKRDQSMLDLLAVIHCDGGHHTEAVGIEQSIKDALSAVCVLKGKLAQAEPSAALIRAYNSGYMQGHHDTIEAQFIAIHPLDMDTYHADVVAELGLSAAPQADPIDPHMIVADDRFPDEQAEPKREPRPCTCHPDDNPPVPCAQKYALNECRATRSGPDEAQIEARDALLDFISENGTASEGVQHYLDRYVRAALAQVEQEREPNPDEVICPACTHQFRAIPENVQAQLWALDDVQIGTLSTQGLFASMHPQDVADAVRLVERAHRIGGSDAE